MKKEVKLNCWKCGSEINVDQLLVSQFEESIKKDLQSELIKKEADLNKKREEHKRLTLEFEEEREHLEEQITARVKMTLKAKENSLKESIRKELNEEKAIQLQQLEDDLKNKSKQLQELNGTKAQLERLRRELKETETRIVLEKEKELNERLEQARFTIKEEAQQESFLKLKEREKVIEDLKVKLDDARRKADQGSMQLQGEVQELEIIELLQDLHPTDRVTQSKKGANAADILQLVRTQNGAECGSIYYESKRTKTWSQEWVKKLKQDNLNTKADILVIVTNALPKDIQRYGIVENVWVCRFDEVKQLSLVLRYGLLKLQSMAIKQHGKESKMEMLYSYLTSEEFKNIFESILEGFKSLQDSHRSEVLKMKHLWKQREKLLDQVLSHSVEFYGSVKGIAGTAIPEIKMLEMLPKAS